MGPVRTICDQGKLVINVAHLLGHLTGKPVCFQPDNGLALGGRLSLGRFQLHRQPHILEFSSPSLGQNGRHIVR